MPRPPRIQYPGAWHHVMNKGSSGQDIYLDRGDRRYFIKLLAESASRFDVEIHGYCLMGNHYHLLVRTPKPELDRMMHHLAGVYTRVFNARHGRDGPLFRARYKSILVETNDYVVAVSRYIHRNPLDIGVADLVGYEWSSLGAYVGARTPQPWLDRTTILAEIGGAAAYRHLVTGPYGSELEALYLGKKLPTRIGPEDAAEQSAAA